jgi:hypothetical protein
MPPCLFSFSGGVSLNFAWAGLESPLDPSISVSQVAGVTNVYHHAHFRNLLSKEALALPLSRWLWCRQSPVHTGRTDALKTIVSLYPDVHYSTIHNNQVPYNWWVDQ